MLQSIIAAVYFLPGESFEMLQSITTLIKRPKGFILMNEGKVEQQLYLIKKGIVRAYVYNDVNEVTFWFGKEGDVVVSMRSYVEGKPGYEDIELLEDCELYEISFAKLQQLFETDIHIANWGRKLIEKELIKTENRLISSQSKPAAERYSDLLLNHPDLLKRVQLSHIASYLGITPVSLSRIRAGQL